MGLFRKGKTGITAKFHGTDLVICSHYRQGKTLSYSQINTVLILYLLFCKCVIILVIMVQRRLFIEKYLLSRALNYFAKISAICDCAMPFETTKIQISCAD